MTAGRPTSYKAEYCQKADEYLEENQDEVNAVVESENENTGRTRYEHKFRVRLPTIEGFALYLGVHKDSLYEWEKKHKEFSDALNKIRTEQHNRLINEGLAGNYNSTIAKLILSNNHGMREKSDTDITTGGEKLNFDDKQINTIAERIAERSRSNGNPPSEETSD